MLVSSARTHTHTHSRSIHGGYMWDNLARLEEKDDRAWGMDVDIVNAGHSKDTQYTITTGI